MSNANKRQIQTRGTGKQVATLRSAPPVVHTGAPQGSIKSEPLPVSPVDDAVHRANVLLTNQHDLLDQMYHRLNGLLAPPSPSQTGATDRPVYSVQHVEDLQSIGDRCDISNAMLRDLLDRLAV